jgi:hypothetical protein
MLTARIFAEEVRDWTGSPLVRERIVHSPCPLDVPPGQSEKANFHSAGTAHIEFFSIASSSQHSDIASQNGGHDEGAS